ncbi:restriction endonuclease subunit S [Methanolobus sp. ZRKC5]|uniref:restriction endonuclease subunit S n=1 Tax=unclassified Methanolobus TaxID=2629569 RepID=UPI00313EDB7A
METKVILTSEKTNPYQEKKGWEKVKLGDICKLKNGFAFKSSEYKTEGVPVIRISDIKEASATCKSAVNVHPKSEYEDYLIENGDILIAMSGATTGKFGIFKDKVKAYQNQRVGNFKLIDNNLLYKSFLFYQLHSLKRRIEKDAYGGAQPNISSKKIEEMEIIIASLPEQRAIVSKIELLFSELDNGIANLKLAQEQLKVYRQAVLKKAFVGDLTRKWREQQVGLPSACELLEEIRREREESIKSTNRRMKSVVKLNEEEIVDLPKIPVGWKWVKLQELCNLRGGVTKGRKLEGKKKISLPYLRVANVQDGYLDLSEIKYIDVLEGDLEKYRLIKGDILYTEGGDKDKLGRGTIWKEQIEDCIHQNHVFRARPYSKNLVSAYIGYFSQTQTAKRYFFKNAKQTVNLASINLTVLSNLPFPFCLLPEQQAIVSEIETRLSVCDKMEQDIAENLEKAEALRQSILKRAFEGKLLNERELEEVRNAPDWEPANLLLERVKTEKAESGK